MYTDIGIQLFISNDRNRVRRIDLGLSQDGACTDLFENLSENSLSGDLSNDIIVNPPFLSFVNTFNVSLDLIKYSVLLNFSDRFAVGQNVATTWSFEKEAPNKDSPEFRRHIKGKTQRK
jgi:hypothetical protein